MGSTNGRLYALNALNGSENWKYPDPVRTPGDPSQVGEVDRRSCYPGSDGAIYFGSDDGHLYALNPNGTLRFKYPAAGSPIGAVKVQAGNRSQMELFYFGANDGQFYAIQIRGAANDPPNIQNLYLTSAELGAQCFRREQLVCRRAMGSQSRSPTRKYRLQWGRKIHLHLEDLVEEMPGCRELLAGCEWFAGGRRVLPKHPFRIRLDDRRHNSYDADHRSE